MRCAQAENYVCWVPPPHVWSLYLTEIGPRDTVALKGAVSLAEVPAALFVIGRRHGRRITVREPILWDTHQFTTRFNYIDKTEMLFRR